MSTGRQAGLDYDDWKRWLNVFWRFDWLTREWDALRESPDSILPTMRLDIEQWLRERAARPATAGKWRDKPGEHFASIAEAAAQTGYEDSVREIQGLLIAHMENHAPAAFEGYVAEMRRFEEMATRRKSAMTPAKAARLVKRAFRERMLENTDMIGVAIEFADFRMDGPDGMESPELAAVGRDCGGVRYNFLADLLASEDTIKNHPAAGGRLAYMFRNSAPFDALAELYAALLEGGIAVHCRKDLAVPPEARNTAPAVLGPFVAWVQKQTETYAATAWEPLPPFEPASLHHYRNPGCRLAAFWEYAGTAAVDTENGLFEPVDGRIYNRRWDAFAPLAAARLDYLAELWHQACWLAPGNPAIPAEDERFQFDNADDGDARFRRWLARLEREYRAATGKEP